MTSSDKVFTEMRVDNRKLQAQGGQRPLVGTARTAAILNAMDQVRATSYHIITYYSTSTENVLMNQTPHLMCVGFLIFISGVVRITLVHTYRS